MTGLFTAYGLPPDASDALGGTAQLRAPINRDERDNKRMQVTGLGRVAWHTCSCLLRQNKLKLNKAILYSNNARGVYLSSNRETTK